MPKSRRELFSMRTENRERNMDSARLATPPHCPNRRKYVAAGEVRQ
jgi:hypothetical protein